MANHGIKRMVILKYIGIVTLKHGVMEIVGVTVGVFVGVKYGVIVGV